MGEVFHIQKEAQNARIALLRYYSSGCRAHGAYILTSVLAIFGFFGFLPAIGHLDELVKTSIAALALSGFSTALIHFMGRSLFWGYLASNIINVKPLSYELAADYLKREVGVASNTYLGRLHFACSDYVRKKYAIVGKFHSLKNRWLVYVFVGSLAVSFVVSPYIL
jgi:hypothetical protein